MAMAAPRPADEATEAGDEVEVKIDTALKRAYQCTAEEPVPDQFIELLAKLKEQGRK